MKRTWTLNIWELIILFASGITLGASLPALFAHGVAVGVVLPSALGIILPVFVLVGGFKRRKGNKTSV